MSEEPDRPFEMTSRLNKPRSLLPVVEVRVRLLDIGQYELPEDRKLALKRLVEALMLRIDLLRGEGWREGERRI